MSLTSCEDILGEWSRPTPTPVTPGGGGSSSGVASISFTVPNLRFGMNSATPITLTANISPSDATITWESSDKAVATVNNGEVTPVAEGKAIIYAKAGDKTAECPVYVYAGKASISDGDVTVTSGEWYIEGDGTEVTNTITIADGASAILDGININNSTAGTTPCIICQGDATITLADGSNNTITAPGTFAAIQAAGNGTDGKKLTIKGETAGTGKLTATAGYHGAAIGSNKNQSCSDIEIQGGDITANGGSLAAGIGSGNAETADVACGTITISDGKVTANGGVNGGAGIGTGAAYEHSQTCGGINITGGTITANGGGTKGGAGIGTGMSKSDSGGSSNQNCNNIDISGGTVEATGGDNAAGIGTGYAFYDATYHNPCNQTCGTITIGTGVISVTATAGSGCSYSIGKGVNKENKGTILCGTVTIGVDATTYATGVNVSPFSYPAP